MGKDEKAKKQHLGNSLRKIKSRFSVGLSKVKTSKLALYAIVLLVGIGIGIGGSILLTDTSQSTGVIPQTSSQTKKSRTVLSDKEKLQLQYQRVDEDVVKSKDRVEDDLIEKDITQAQYDLINKKIDEVAKIRKTLDNTDDNDRSKLRELKVEVRKWSDDNNLKYSYVSRVL